jgi:SAM-dependent methyltransferase
MRVVTAAERWLGAMWPVVRGPLPAPPAQVVEIGCGPLGGFVPMLRSSGYDAVGIDPAAPDGDDYRRVEFEQLDALHGIDAVVASTSLHHVADPAEVIDRVASALAPGGMLVVVEWAWAAFDEPTAQWCFQRLGSHEEAGWLRRRRDEWLASGQPWSVFLQDWARKERLHPWEKLLQLLDTRFDRKYLAHGPYFFPDLAQTSDEDERAAIEAEQIRATRVDYVGRLSDEVPG